MKKFSAIPLLFTLTCVLLISSCTSQEDANDDTLLWDTVQDTTQRVAVIEGGLKGPEAVQYDAEQDLYFVSNFNGSGNAADSNAFISRVQPNGSIDSLKFMTGTEEAPFHSGRGMFIVGDTLFVADLNGVHGFNRRTGKHLSFADLSNFDPGFVNDIAAGSDGALYVTDTGNPRLFRISGNQATIAVDSLPNVSNGIIYDKNNKQLVMAPWGDAHTFLTWDPINKKQGEAGTGVGGNYDGIEFVGNHFIVSSQVDSSLQVVQNGKASIFVKLPGRPADIGLDTKRNQVAVPYVALNRVDVWQLPKKEH